ncbi:hypothetical protein LTR97_003109 [Elasticomyces elasticus]|uniref:DUF6594 domain-containing protein n=1 Tax=Elasticomyces elasticus TaxID=574655 RepID=A0AAN7ZPT5_9PEZI|nr:hypothetical protein LTR97_003109 [Elasticomyces elasticus]
MSETAADASPPVPPRLLVSRPTDDAANKSGHRALASRKRTAGPSPVHEHTRTSSSEWTDIDESPPRRRRSSKRSLQRHDLAGRSPYSNDTVERESRSELSRFFPKLGRILEGSESASRPSTRGSDVRRQRDRSPARRHRRRDETGGIHRRSTKHRTGGVQRRNDSLLKINPSLLSVLSGFTATTDRSSGSSSTVTQQSYDRRGSDSSRTPTGRPRRVESEAQSNISSRSRSKSPNVFDFMVASTVDEEHDDRSFMSSSSSSSHYEPSVAGSSEAPDTPSSRSTFPSPTTTRCHSVAELRRKYDPQYAASEVSVRTGSQSPGSSIGSVAQQPEMEDVAEEDEDELIEPSAPSEFEYDRRQRSTSRSSSSSHRANDRSRQQEASMRQHMAYAQQAQQGHYVDPVYGQHRSQSASSTQSSPYGYPMAMQQYQWPSPPALPPQPIAMNGHYDIADRPPVPDAPDLSKRTLAGYEMLALELSTTESPVQPLYRKFEYLNHRILLHLQDELCELEEQLRTLDEIIAQMSPASPESPRTPASRRGEAYNGSEIHHQRTILLGRIFIKTEQYNRAMTAYTGMSSTTSEVPRERVDAYCQWMEKHTPVHAVEARFLQRVDDLVLPGQKPHVVEVEASVTKHAALAYLPVALMLPLLLFSIIPTLAGRLAVTALIAAGAFLVAATTQIRHLLPTREWAVCGAAYVLLMAAIAGCIPQHAA